MKRVLIGILIFLVYLAVVIGVAFALHFEGTKLILFIAILGLIGLLTLVFVLWFLGKNAGGQSTGPDTPDSINLGNLLRDADAKIRQTNRAGAKSLAALPLIYVIGDENSAKTQTVLQSGLDPELLAGNVYRDGIVVPTQLANLWLAGNYVLVEAGGALLREPSLWVRLVRATIPARLGSIFGDSRLPARSVVVCVSIERIMAPNTSEQIKALAQSLNERLRQLSQTLGIALPVYVLFTKLDTVQPFAEYAGRLAEEEVKLPIGSLLSSLSSGSGLYTEQATALIGGKFDQLVYALSEFRLDVLSRGGELQALARAYEFPRDLRKLRNGIVAFLAEVARPSQIGVNPFLRGFFFAGMRAHIVEDILDIGPAHSQPVAPQIESGATRIFSFTGLQQAQQPTPQPRRSGTRKVAQWVFLPHLFSKILLADKSALETSRASTRTSFLKRTLLACAIGLFLIVLSLFTISFFNNQGLKHRVATAAAAPVSPVNQGAYAAQGDLESLDKLRAVLAELDDYRKNGAPLMYRFGLYHGDALYPVACQAYAGKFRTLLLSPTQTNIVTKINLALQAPATAGADYGATYNPFKAYIITATNPDPDTPQDTVSFLPNTLLAEWTGNGTPASDVSRLALAQFQFYASLLPGPSSCLAAAGGPRSESLVARTRAYLNSFQGSQHVYQSMLAAANNKVPGFNFNGKFNGSSPYILDTFPIPGAFTRDGFSFMQNAILHPEPYFKGEEWVLGPSSGPAPDIGALSSQLRAAYVADYLQTWRSYLSKAQFVSYRNFPDASMKLSALDSNTSPILELFALISDNTAVAYPEISAAFQAPQAVVPPSTGPNSPLIGDKNQGYIKSLGDLESAINAMKLNPATANDPNAAAPIAQAAQAADEGAKNLLRSFNPDPAGSMDKISFNRLEDPIKSLDPLISNFGAGAAGEKAKSFCDQLDPLLRKFPFNSQSTTEATPDEVAQVFAPGQGFSQFVNSPAVKAIVSPQGSGFAPTQGSTIHVSANFLTFLNNAQKFSSTLFANGTQPTLDFTLQEVKTPGIPDAILKFDNQQITSAGQKVNIHWVSSPGSHYSLSTPGNSSTQPPSPWAAFHFGLDATRITPNQLKFNISLNKQSNAVVFFDVSGSGAPLLNPDFMKGLHCVSAVSR